MQPETGAGIKTWQWVVTVIVVIVLIVIGIMIFSNKGSQNPTTGTGTPAATTNNEQGINSIVISDQYPGNVVYVSSVQLANPGWVVINSDSNGQPGPIIGETYVTAGISPAKITLSQAMVDGGTYYAVLHSDNGDQKFDPTADTALTDANGNIIMRVFHASASANANVKG